MNILYLDHYAGSIYHGRSFRPYYFGQEWQKNGHKLFVVAGTFSHLRNNQPKSSGWENIDGIEYLWVWTPKYQGNGVKRAFSMLVFFLQLFLHMPTIIKRSQPNAIIGSSVYMMDMIPAWFMKKFSKNKPKLVFELHDLWPASLIELGGMNRFHPFVVMMSFFERIAYKLCDGVVSILPNTLDHMRKFDIKPNQFFHVPNGIYLPDWQKKEVLPSELINKIEHIKQRSSFVVGYAGAHGLPNKLQNLLEAAKELKDEKVSFILIGDGVEKQNLVKKAETEDIDNVIFLPKISKREIPEFLSSCDALYVGLPKEPLFRYGVSPNKVYDYMMAQKPIIYGIEASNDLAQEAKCGVSIDADDVISLSNGIKGLVEMDDATRQKMGENGKSFVLKHHSYDQLAKKFIQSIEGV